MQKQMIIAGLKARPVRTSVSILAVALEVTLIVVIIGLVTGLVSEKAARTMGVGAEITVQPSGASIFMELSGNTMPLSLADKLMQEVPDIKAIAPIQLQINTKDGIETVFGIDAKSWEAVTGGFTWHGGRMFQGPDEVVVDNVWAKSKVPEAKVGDTVEVLNHPYKVAGIVEQGKGARVYMSWEAASVITGQSDHFAVFYVKLKNPDAVKQVKHQIEALLPDYKVSDINDLVSLMTSAANIPGLNQFIRAVISIALAIGVLVIFLSMYTTITERTREIGILRSLGASKAYIVGLIFQEAALISILGVVFGVGVSFLLRRVLTTAFPTLIVDITFEWIVKASAFAILSGIIGAFYPSLKAAAQDPVEALAYE